MFLGNGYKPQYNRGNLICIHISDIHFGAFDPFRQYHILKEQFLDRINNLQFDIVSIDGDLFDHKCMANSDIAMYANIFVSELYEICRSKNATLIIISGTRSHDAGQLKLFYPLISDDFRIVESARFEYVKGAKILCLPEEYNMGEDYYNNLLQYSGFYDMCFMHGNIVGCIPGLYDRDLNTEKNPVFNIDDFGGCYGCIISGHIHTSNNYNKHFYYCGSPYRWQFGEENPKGFLITLNNLDTGKYVVKLEEIISDLYITININDLLSNPPKDIIRYIDNKKRTEGINYIRCIVTNIEDEKYLDTLRLVKNHYKSSNSIFINDTKYQKNIVNSKDTYTEKKLEYDFIFDINLTPEEKFVKYVNTNKGYEFVTVDKLIEILSKE